MSSTYRSSPAKRSKERRLFLSQNGDPLTQGLIRIKLRLYRHKAGIQKPVSPHTFRRTCATHLLQQGADIRHIQVLLGHKSLKTTQIYTKIMPREVQQTHAKTHPRIIIEGEPKPFRDAGCKNENP